MLEIAELLMRDQLISPEENKTIKIIVIGKPYHIPVNKIGLLFTSSFSIPITFLPPKNQINLQSLHQIFWKYYMPTS